MGGKGVLPPGLSREEFQHYVCYSGIPWNDGKVNFPTFYDAIKVKSLSLAIDVKSDNPAGHSVKSHFIFFMETYLPQ